MGRIGRIDAVIPRFMHEGEAVPGLVSMPDRNESRVPEHSADGTADLPPQSSSKVGCSSKELLVEQEAHRDRS